MQKSHLKPKNSELILLPRGYLSPSQYTTWHTNKQKYINEYFKGIKTERENSFMTYGKKIALYIEKGEFADEPVVVFGARFLPRRGHAEHEQTTILKTAYGDIKLLGKFDDFDPSSIDIFEHKTGKTVWTENRANNLIQLLFYGVICLNEFQKFAKFELNWVETTDIDDQGNKLAEVRPTGRTERFIVMHSMQQLEEMKKKIISTCIEIDREYRKYLKKLEQI